MERKIGEIFEHNGEWYQCVIGGDCRDCAFNNDNCEERKRITLKNKLTKEEVTGLCTSELRSDGKSAIFKKLEKVGEPYERYIGSNKSIKVQRYRLPYRYAILPKEPFMILEPNYKNSIEIGIKQIKEDMEENKLNLKPFDIQKAREGKPVCTRDGHKARIICFDKKGAYPIVALVNDYNEEEYIKNYDEFGKKIIGRETGDDLMMLPEKKEGWINVYKERIYSTKEEAIEATYDGVTYIDTIKISWEE